MKEIILRNAAKCLGCGTVIESSARHELHSCTCGNIFVDGGHDYIRMGLKSEKILFQALHEYEYRFEVTTIASLEAAVGDIAENLHITSISTSSNDNKVAVVIRARCQDA